MNTRHVSAMNDNAGSWMRTHRELLLLPCFGALLITFLDAIPVFTFSSSLPVSKPVECFVTLTMVSQSIP